MFVWALVVAVALLAANAIAYAVPFSSNTPDFSVSAVSNTVSVICTGTVRVSCQAVRIDGSTQQLLGTIKIVDETSKAYLDIQTLAYSSSAILVCFSTLDRGGRCVQLAVDLNFGLMGDVVRPLTFCATGEVCGGLGLAMMDSPTGVTICYGLDNSYGACSVLEQLPTQPTVRRVLKVSEAWDWPVALEKVPNGPLVLCTVIKNLGDTQCRSLADPSLQVVSKQPLSLGSSSIVAAAYVGQVDTRPQLTICALSTDNFNLYCSAVYLLSNTLFVSSRSAYTASYDDGLSGLKLSRLSEDASSLIAMGCLTTPDMASDQLVCSLITTSAQGVIVVDENEMVADENGFYYQNVPQALATVEDVGAYVETSNVVGKLSDQSPDRAVIGDTTVLPDFMGLFAASSPVSVQSIGCVRMGFNELDTTRFCVATGAQLSRAPPPPPPFPPAKYCNVRHKWECRARSQYCGLVRGVKCTSKYACDAQKTVAACNALIAAGGQCKVDSGKCVPTYIWNSITMCQTVTAAAICSASPGCVWAANACRVAPYCQYTSPTLCRQASGCAWVGNRCGSQG
jgi:hypothetical protein